MKVAIHITTWMNLENAMLSVRRQTQVVTCVMQFISNVQNKQIHSEIFSRVWRKKGTENNC